MLRLDPQSRAAEILDIYRGKCRVLLCFGPQQGPSEVAANPFYRSRFRDLGVPEWRQRSLEGPAINYYAEASKRDLVEIPLIDPGVCRPPDKSDPRVSLETETALREAFGVRDDEMIMILIGKDGRRYRSYTPGVWYDDILDDVDELQRDVSDF